MLGLIHSTLARLYFVRQIFKSLCKLCVPLRLCQSCKTLKCSDPACVPSHTPNTHAATLRVPARPRGGSTERHASVWSEAVPPSDDYLPGGWAAQVRTNGRVTAAQGLQGGQGVPFGDPWVNRRYYGTMVTLGILVCWGWNFWVARDCVVVHSFCSVMTS